MPASVVTSSTVSAAGMSRLSIRPQYRPNRIPPRSTARTSCPVTRNPDTRKKTSTPPETRPSQMW